MNEITQVTGRALPLLLDDIDTDRIIPARHMRCVTFDGLGEHVFEDDRSQNPQHPFNDPRFQGASILLVGRNFGCGSSREHAPQALMRWGIRAIVGESFAEIFFGNCVALGIPAVSVSRADLERLGEVVQANPQTAVTVDLEQQQVRWDDEAIGLTMPDSARSAFISGRWDFLSQLLEAEEAIRQTAQRLPYTSNFAESA